jgi:uncharacterized membrane protein (DUF2068 family)
MSWLCLRCGTYVVGKPHYRAPLAKAPLVLRGKVLRQAFILRLLAAERATRGIFLALLGYGIFRFRSSQGSLTKLLETDLPALRGIAKSVGYNLDSSETLHVIRNVLSLGKHTLALAALGAFAYAALQLTEAIGLWLMKRWGEYFSAVATAIFIPLEIYEISHHATIIKAGALIINIAAVLYLLLSKRLFGIRGGRKTYEAELQADNLLEITQAAG